MTGLLTRDLDRSGRISLARFYSRRAKRLLPAASLVLVGVAVLTVTCLPRIRWRDIGGDIVASGTYVINYRLADRATDYLAGGLSASPLQHFWSLAVEEQFYILWPIFLVGASKLCGRGNKRWPLLVAITACPSFCHWDWSIHYSPQAPQSCLLRDHNSDLGARRRRARWPSSYRSPSGCRSSWRLR